ncbi:MAG: HDOD domain-containing protein [Rhodocyclaceae bacterium]|nr:HDOD domain-containing protein [Rhodocyclaceae bacterium]
MTSESFPLIVLQPRLGPGQEWDGVRVRGAELTDATTLQRLFDEFGLAETIAGLACLLPSGVIEQLDTAALPEGLSVQPDTDSPPAAEPAPATQAARSSPKQTLLLKLLGQITCDADTRDIEATLKHDPQLLVQLLRLVNSVAFAPNTRINSFAHAITLLGRRQLQRWLQLLLYASQGSGVQGNPLLSSAALRATLMEGLCKATGNDRAVQDEAFMVGMFSRLEAVFSQPLATIIEPLQLAAAVSAALLERTGTLGDLLTLVEAAELGPDVVAPALKRTGIGNEVWCKAQIEALRWTMQVSRES